MAGSVNSEIKCKHVLLLFSRCNIFGYFCAVFMTKGIQRPALRQTEHAQRKVLSNPFFARTHKRIMRKLGINA